MGSAQSTHTTTTENKEQQQKAFVEDNNNSGSGVSGHKEEPFTEVALPESYDSSDDDDDDSDDDDDEEWNERLAILEDSHKLKKLAEFFLRPELPVTTTNPTATARCYFDRPSAPVTNNNDDEEERNLILKELKQLKKLSVDYLHPELPVETSDPAACGRNYFTRPSAPIQITADSDEEEEEEHNLLLKDMKQMKKLAIDYMHPELPVRTTDPCATGRNYFTRPSAPVASEEADGEERSRILEDMLQMKKLAVDYMHPELPVATTDPCAAGRNYFTRPSAPTMEDDEDEERSRILEEMQQMKKLAVDYLHPELPVSTTDPCATGRNYFTRPSAPTMEDDEDEERSRILEEMQQMKKLAVSYLHPEYPVETADSTIFGRNYFSRVSAPGPAKDQTHTYCEYVDHGYHHVIDHGHHYYWYSKNEVLAHEHHHNDVYADCPHHDSENFYMEQDEEIMDDTSSYYFKETTLEVEPFKGEHAIDFVMKDEASVSRSPDCVLMLTWRGAQ